MPQIQSAAMIVNAHSRKGQAQYADACRAASAFSFPVDAHAVEDPSTLDDTMRRVLASSPDLVILGGGDGTISGLVDHLVGRDTILAVLPLGTANSFARTLGLPLDIAGAMDVAANGVPRRIDLGRIDDDHFANCAAIGVSPRIAESVPPVAKKLCGRAGYLAWATWQFLRFRPFRLIVEQDGEIHRMKSTEVRIANGRFHGGAEVIPEADVASGTIVVQAVKGPFKRRLVRNWVTASLHLPVHHPETISFVGTALRITTEPALPISIDGEVLARTPVTARVAAGAVRVMVPRTP